MATSFTWVPLYTDLATRLLDWESRQGELIAALEGLRAKGVKVSPLNDQDSDGASFLLKEIDPFTVFATFNRGIKEQERLAILTALKALLGSNAALPEDFQGLPVVNNQKSWFIAYQPKRKADDVSWLWRVFRLALSPDPLGSKEFAAAFNKAIEVWGTSTNLTMGLFWIRPDTFLNLDKTNRQYLKITLPSKGLSADYYLQTLTEAKKLGKPFVTISKEAFDAAHAEGAEVTSAELPLPPDHDYWLAGAYWDDKDPADQTARFLVEGIWQNGYVNQYLDQVKSMMVGDRIAIKATSTKKFDLPFEAHGNTVSRMEVKAIGTIVANRNDGRTVEVEWDSQFKPKTWYFYTGRSTIWRLKRTEPFAKALIEFIWEGKPQDYDWFAKQWWEDGPAATGSKPKTPEGSIPFGVEDMIKAGAFLTTDEVEEMVSRLRMKKNLILQGAPGVGKSFLARMVAYALMQEKDTNRVQYVQFHQSFTYDDFVRGYRPLPEKDGTFGLQDAVFHRFCKKAEGDPDNEYVFIIDEINRGNLSQIFGELLMLIEADKRGAEHSVELVYHRPKEPKFFVPANVYIIGLMNLADRSLAIVDYALRRRFSFVTLTPKFGSEQYRGWLLERKLTEDLATLIITRMTALNKEISDDALLGTNYQIGHSFFCPKGNDFSGLDRPWFDSIVRTEIVPLIREYWFDNAKRCDEVAERLLLP